METKQPSQTAHGAAAVCRELGGLLICVGEAVDGIPEAVRPFLRDADDLPKVREIAEKAACDTLRKLARELATVLNQEL